MHRPPNIRLRDLRLERGFRTQGDFCSHARAQGIKINLRRYRDIESGRVEKPKIEEIRDICLAMGISADQWLVGPRRILDISDFSDKEAEFMATMAKGLLRIRSESRP